MNHPSQEPSGHMTEHEMAALLDHQLAPAERQRIEAHLESCAACRAELIEMQRITATYGRKSGRTARRWWIPAALAAGLMAIVLVPRITGPSAAPEPVRSRNGEGTPRLATVSPADNATVPAGRITFAWRSAIADVYRVTLMTESGQPVWTTETSDTSAALPSSVALQGGAAYFWRVEAVSSGISATTGVHRLQIAR